MQYDKCPRCDLNYKPINEEYCAVCRATLKGIYNDDEEEQPMCPLCYKYPIGYDEIICTRCKNKRNKE